MGEAPGTVILRQNFFPAVNQWNQISCMLPNTMEEQAGQDVPLPVQVHCVFSTLVFSKERIQSRDRLGAVLPGRSLLSKGKVHCGGGGDMLSGNPKAALL